MADTNYTAAMLAFDNPVGSLFYYPLFETSGTFANKAGHGPALTTNGTIVRGEQTLLSGETPVNTSVSQNKDTHMAERDDNFLYDRPAGASAQPNKMTMGTWFKPTKLKPGGSNGYFLIGKGPSINCLVVRGTKVNSEINGQDPLGSSHEISKVLGSYPGDLIATDAVYFVVSVFDGPNNLYKLYLNGIEVGSRTLASGQMLNHSSGGKLYIGGHAGFGNSGITGFIQHPFMLYNNALSLNAVRLLYKIGLYDSSNAPVAGKNALVFPWSESVLAANASRTGVTLTNDSDTTMYLALGSTAQANMGIRLGPWGESRTINTYTGQISAIHGGMFGAKNLTILEQ